MLKRTVIKLSGEATAGNNHDAHGFCDETIASLVARVKEAHDLGVQIALVVGGGNFWRGRTGQSVMDRVKADQIGMLATVMNAIYLSEAFNGIGIRSEIMTPMPFANMTRVYDKTTALSLMVDGCITFHAAGLCHPYFSTDTVTALRAAELEADCVLFTKNGVGGVYDKAPENGNDARMYKSLSYDIAIAKQLQFVDATALSILVEADIPSFVFGLSDSIVDACKNPGNTGFGTLLKKSIEEEFYGH